MDHIAQKLYNILQCRHGNSSEDQTRIIANNIAFLLKHVQNDVQPHQVSLPITKTLDLDALKMRVQEKICMCIHQWNYQLLVIVRVCVDNNEENIMEALEAEVDRLVDSVVEIAGVSDVV